MEQLPIELWEKIGRSACMDGGRTGCSLSLVSRGMSHATQGVRFTSVMITSRDSCIAFAKLFSQMDPTPSIYHLLISYRAQPLAGSWPSLSKPEPDEADGASSLILSRAAHTLVTLFLYDKATLPPASCNLLFPNLHDLVIPDLIRTRRQGPYKLMFPKLRRLRIEHPWPILDIEFWEDVSIIAPNITFVLLAYVPGGEALIPFLRVLMDVPEHLTPVHLDLPTPWGGVTLPRTGSAYELGSQEASQAAVVASKLASLTTVWVEPAWSKSCSWQSPARSMLTDLINDLKSIASRAEERGGTRQLRVLKETEKYRMAQAQADWLDILGGGDGPWCDYGSRGTPGSNLLTLVPEPNYFALLESADFDTEGDNWL